MTTKPRNGEPVKGEIINFRPVASENPCFELVREHRTKDGILERVRRLHVYWSAEFKHFDICIHVEYFNEDGSLKTRRTEDFFTKGKGEANSLVAFFKSLSIDGGRS